MSDTATPARLLLKAIRSLPVEEQDVVLQYVLERDPDRAPRLSRGALALGGEMPEAGAFASASPLRTFPVRLPEPLYDRLKTWSEEHEFPMAVVVRGLLERFLDAQEGAGAGSAP
jgi:hypothetical protein